MNLSELINFYSSEIIRKWNQQKIADFLKILGGIEVY